MKDRRDKTANLFRSKHYSDVIMSAMASRITGISMVCSTFCSGTYQRKQQSSASLAFVWGIHRWPANYPHKGPVTRKMFPFDNVIMNSLQGGYWNIEYFEETYSLSPIDAYTRQQTRPSLFEIMAWLLFGTKYNWTQDQSNHSLLEIYFICMSYIYTNKFIYP